MLQTWAMHRVSNDHHVVLKLSLCSIILYRLATENITCYFHKTRHFEAAVVAAVVAVVSGFEISL